MKQLLIYIILNVFLFTFNSKAFSQGCSDAGVCTINTIKDHSFNLSEEIKKRNFFNSGITYGIGEHSVTMINPYVEYTNLVSKKISLSGKLVYAFVNGDLANTNNLSDLIISFNYSMLNTEMNNISLVLGVKIPLDNSNIKENNSPLPMHYQSSLGTYDLIIGANYVYQNLGLSFAFQQPIVNSNENEFLSPTNPLLKESKYQSTNSYDRQSDLMLRLSYQVMLFDNNLTIRPGLLGIYHLLDDTYIDQNNIEQVITGSQGLTLNGNIFINYNISNTKQIELSVGSPFITRNSRPDGLTRKLVTGIEYTYSF